MTKHQVDIDETQLAEAARALGTLTPSQTISEALSLAIRVSRVRAHINNLASRSATDLHDPEAMGGAWPVWPRTP